MSAGIAPPLFGGHQSLRRFSVADYHRMIETGILDDTDKVELLEGFVVLKMPRNPPHDGTIQLAQDRLSPGLPAGWCVRIQSAVTLDDSEPEPDLAVVRGNNRGYLTRHPTAADLGLIVEVADTSLARDRDDKGRIYARAGVPVCWIINLVDGRVEVYSDPGGPAGPPGYARREEHAPGGSVVLTLDGAAVGSVAVADLLP
jgi:Uma2 family endonuclease